MLVGLKTTHQIGMQTYSVVQPRFGKWSFFYCHPKIMLKLSIFFIPVSYTNWKLGDKFNLTYLIESYALRRHFEISIDTTRFWKTVTSIEWTHRQWLPLRATRAQRKWTTQWGSRCYRWKYWALVILQIL